MKSRASPKSEALALTKIHQYTVQDSFNGCAVSVISILRTGTADDSRQ